jgi:hypothetical protein
MGANDMSQEGSVSADMIPLTRAATAEDAGGALLFMVSRAGAYISKWTKSAPRVFGSTLTPDRWKYSDFRWWKAVDSAGNILNIGRE